MTAAVFFGCAFIAFGPALALYVFTIATEPLRIIFLIAGRRVETCKNTEAPDCASPSGSLSFLLVGVSTDFVPCLVHGKSHY
ncbi:APH1B isoform 7 [Pan troglodytes]|uniref:Gamma-secretase subunit APH-1 n=5 Tax=Homininae TaxID=207598 RepID=Q4R1J8_HUMAN|nr:aph-1-like B, gamma-secretase subunit [Homo sapiens]KAI4058172.1 aph-1 homolog B, gamma-secretase subunit [Homo sapiens]PNI74485.1 APH1B isoform 7 [Pan troglodytes]BAE02660.1 anterior pharynx defective 1b splice variant-2 [Homo sapiens]